MEGLNRLMGSHPSLLVVYRYFHFVYFILDHDRKYIYFVYVSLVTHVLFLISSLNTSQWSSNYNSQMLTVSCIIITNYV